MSRPTVFLPALALLLTASLLHAAELRPQAHIATTPSPSPSPVFPDVRCLAIRPFVRTVSCICYLVISGQLRTNRNNVSRMRCLAQQSREMIMELGPNCNFYRRGDGRIVAGRLLRDIRRIVRMCVDPNAPILRFVQGPN
eukprot:GFKZ01014880.1.p1 GENE.GFKZ01014880.1~~GFKZ01014880.1.p1  ORF type:complete len:140 (+),score=13.63 GFKZ01014880.1:296-715(+)